MGFSISRVKKILLLSFFLATYMILKRLLSVKILIVSLSFSFVPFILCAIMLGRKHTILLGALGDILGMILFPRGAFFPGYTISSMLTGYIYGTVLYQQHKIVADRKFLIRLIISVTIVGVFINFGLNTVWLYCITKNMAKIIAPIKLVKQFILIPFKVTTIYCSIKMLEYKMNKSRATFT